MEYGFGWPTGLGARHLSQLLFGKRAGSLSVILPEILEQTGLTWTLEECYAWLDQFEQTCKVSGFYVLDSSPHPEVWNAPELPRMVMASVFFVDPDIHNPARLLRRYRGEMLGPTLTETERCDALAAVRQGIIYHQPCQAEGCEQVVVITLGQAGRAIEKYNLTGPDNTYRHAKFCKACRQKSMQPKDTAPAEGRTLPAAPKPKKNRKEKGVATLGEVAATHKPTEQST